MFTIAKATEMLRHRPMRLAELLLGIATAVCASSVCAQADEVLQLPSTVSHQVPISAVAAELTLVELEETALACHPSLAELASQVRAARCKCYQAGLPPNPTVGYVASEIGNEGNAGQQGAYLGQKFIRGGKLKLDQAILCQEVRKLEQDLAAQQQRVLTAVRTAFYDVYLAQREVQLSEQLLKVSREATTTVQKLFDAEEARRTDVLQAKIENGRIDARLKQAGFALEAAWRRLATAVGQSDMSQQSVAADAESLDWPHGWRETRKALLAGSPEIAAAVAEINRAKAKRCRACAEPISDVTAQVSVQYDYSTKDTVTGVQVGLPLPLWNRNQGGIGQAQHELAAAKRRLETLELRLVRKLAQRMRQYQSAQAKATAYREGVLKPSEETLQLVNQAFAAGEASYLDLLTVQRTYFQANLDYLNALREVNAGVQMMTGFLLNEE